MIFYSVYLPSPHPPSPTLFPYTTLFRSRPINQIRRRAHRNTVLGPSNRVRLDRQTSHRRRQSITQRQRPSQPRRSEEHTSNSSHLVISYAVFCLKKKKK